MSVRGESLRRYEHLGKCLSSEKLRAHEYVMCKNSIFHFMSNWAWTFDPRAEHKHIPFILYDYQHEAITWLNERFDNDEVGLIEKSRDMGATWLVVSWAVHKWIFTDGFTCLFGSKTEGDVDSPSVDSIFGKVRYILSRLPWFLKPNMNVKINDKRDADTYLSLINPVNANEISGDSANVNFGRSGRRSVVFLDEFAFVDQSDKIWAAISEVSRVIIPMSTANGKGNMFYALRNKGTIPVLTLHWSRHPHKDQAWYDDKKKTMEPHQIASEIDIDYSASKSGRVYKRFKREHHVAKEIIYPNPHLEHFVTWDFGIADNMCIIMGQIDALNNVEIYACYDTTDQDIEFFIPLVSGELPANQFFEFLREDEQKRIKAFLKKVFFSNAKGGLVYEFDHYGDFAGTQRTANSRRSVKDRLWSDGNIRLICNPNQSHSNRIQCFDNLLKLKEDTVTGEYSSKFIISPDCDRVIDSVMNYIWDKEDVNNPNLKPKHDWASHYTSALEFLAINRFSLRQKSKISSEVFR